MLSRLIGIGRIALGLGSLVAPRAAARLFALPETDLNPSSDLVSRLVGNRELALGAALALSSEADLPWLLTLSAGVDTADAVASLWTLRDGLPRRAAWQSALSAAAYAALELVALSRLDRRSALPWR